MSAQESFHECVVETLVKASSFETFIHHATMIVRTRVLEQRYRGREKILETFTAEAKRFELDVGDQFVVSLIGASMAEQRKRGLSALHR